MMKPLRKRHLQIWIVSTLLLPAGIITGWLAIPNHRPVLLLHPPAIPLLPVIRHAKNTNEYTLHIRTNKEQSAWQLEWKNKIPLKVPSAAIYRMSTAISGIPFSPGNAELIGRIETKGDYIFPLPENVSAGQSLYFSLYDFIHEKTLDTINFQP